jgi:hypothetical protein
MLFGAQTVVGERLDAIQVAHSPYRLPVRSRTDSMEKTVIRVVNRRNKGLRGAKTHGPNR